MNSSSRTQRSLFIASVILAASCLSANAQMELISDSHFQTGFTVLTPGGAVEGNLQYTAANGAPQWLMGQWDSRQSIYGAAGQPRPDGSVSWNNICKTVIQGPVSSESGDLVLGVNSIQEYANAYRTSTDPWPALLVQQSISEPGGWRAATAPSIAQMNHAILRLEVKLTLANNLYATGYNPSIHASQFPIYFTVQNLNPASEGYGKYFWYGILIYDDRYPVTSAYSLLDFGTQSLIYASGLSDLGLPSGPQLGQWLVLEVDILAHIKNGLRFAWSQGYLTESKNMSDYKIGAMNIGWEVPGLADVEMQVRNLGLTCFVPGSLPQIEVGGLNYYSVPNGDTTPTGTDGTLFSPVSAPGGVSSRIFTVTNANPSASALNLTGTPSVQISGSGASQFLIAVPPSTTVAGGNSTTFEIRYSPNAAGTHNATLTIVSNDSTATPYTFAIRGTAAWPVDDHANSRATATVASLPATVSGNLELPGDVDYFKFTITKKAAVTIKTTGTTNTHGQLENASGNVLAQNDNAAGNLQFLIQRTLNAGTYYLRVKGAAANITGPYVLLIN